MQRTRDANEPARLLILQERPHEFQLFTAPRIGARSHKRILWNIAVRQIRATLLAPVQMKKIVTAGERRPVNNGL